jgi:hypothetical protein
MTRAKCTAAAFTVVLLTLTACGGTDDDSGDTGSDEPSFDSPSESEPVDDEAAIEQTLADYDQALVSMNREQELPAALTAVATDAWADQLFTTYDENFFDNGMALTGRWRTKVDDVTVDGDTAEAEVCIDGNRVYLIEIGGEIPSGAVSQGQSPGVISLVRDGTDWKVDGNKIEEGPC